MDESRPLAAAWNGQEDAAPDQGRGASAITAPSFTGKGFADRGFRPLGLDAHPRYLVLGGKAHGPQPDQHQDAVFDQLVLDFVLRGSGTYADADGRRHALTPGMLLHRYPGVSHSTWYDPASDYAEFWVVLDKTTASQLLQLGLIHRQPVVDVGAEQLVFEEFKLLCRRVARSEEELPSPALLLEVLAFIDGLYQRARRRRAFGPDGDSERLLGDACRLLGDACRLLGQDLDGRQDVASIMRPLGVPYSALRKCFKRALGLSPGRYRIRRRIEAAQRLLRTRSVKQVAIALGYDDQSTFSSQFKKITGVSPGRFQRGGSGSPTAG
jgi:AraC-like DNA-binding protein